MDVDALVCSPARWEKTALSENVNFGAEQLYLRGEILTIAFPMEPWARADGMSGQIFALRRECQIICGVLNCEQGPLLSDFAVRRFPPWSNQTAIHTRNSSLFSGGTFNGGPIICRITLASLWTHKRAKQSKSLAKHLSAKPICFPTPFS